MLVATSAPDFLLREPEEQYREKAADFLTSHQLADFRRCPALYRRKKLGMIPDEDRPAYLVGRALHALVLEGQEAFRQRFAVGGPLNPQTGKPFGPKSKTWEEWAAAQGKPLLKEDEHTDVRNLAAAVRAHGEASALLAEGVPEGVARAEYCGRPCQVRVDWFNPAAGIIDLKTCDDLTWFEADARRYGYAHQLAFYRAVLTAVTGERFPCRFIAVEKKEPFRCGVWTVSDQVLDYCAGENEAAIERLRACEAAGAWPAGYEESRVFDSI
jgi:hypothetical protein